MPKYFIGIYQEYYQEYIKNIPVIFSDEETD